MSPFLQLRLWMREGPAAERVLGGVAAVVLLALLGLALIPVGHRNEPTVLATGAPGGVTAGGGSGSGTSGNAAQPGVVGIGGAPSGSASGGAVGGATTSGGPGASGGSGGPGGLAANGPIANSVSNACAGRTAAGLGVTATEVHIVTTNLSLAGPIGNSTFDVRPDLQAIAKAMADDINQTGGVACGRKIVLTQYDVNPLDPTDGQSKCLQIQQDNPLMVIDFGGYLTPAARACFVQAKIPMTAATAFSATEAKPAYPYLFGPKNLAEEQARNGILGLRDRGFFKGPGFQKLGLFEDACYPSVNSEIDADLAKAGVRPDQISKFVLDCNVSAPPNQIAQAVLQHKVDRATHVFLATSTTNDQSYVRQAVGQSFHPVYGASDYGEVLTASGAENWDASFNGTIGITSGHVGEWTSGIRSPEALACDRIMRSHGVPGFTSEQKDSAVLGYCDLFLFFKAAIDKAGVNPSRTALAKGVESIGLLKTASLGDGTFNQPGKVTGGDFERAVQYHADCKCWKVLDLAYRPAFR